ncbi:MAG: helix-hairpin-helix domain-containing protein [Methylococcales bacterium]
MKDEITEVKGVGPSTASVLARHGIKTVRDLAEASVPQLIAIPGFNEFRARQVKFNAESVLKKSDLSTESGDRSTAKAKPVTQKPETASTVEKKEQIEVTEKTKKDKKKSKQKKKEKSKKKDKKSEKSKDKSTKKGKKKK